MQTFEGHMVNEYIAGYEASERYYKPKLEDAIRQRDALREALEHVYFVATQIWKNNPSDTCLREAARAIALCESEATR